MNLETLIIQVLTDAPISLTSHQIARECRKHITGRVSGQQVYAILCNSLRPLVSVTPSYRWSLLRLDSDQPEADPALSGLVVGNDETDLRFEQAEQNDRLRDQRGLSDQGLGANRPMNGDLHDDTPDVSLGPPTEGAFLVLDDDEWLCD